MTDHHYNEDKQPIDLNGESLPELPFRISDLDEALRLRELAKRMSDHFATNGNIHLPDIVGLSNADYAKILSNSEIFAACSVELQIYVNARLKDLFSSPDQAE